MTVRAMVLLLLVVALTLGYATFEASVNSYLPKLTLNKLNLGK